MDTIIVIEYLAAVSTTVSFLPQALKTLRTWQTKDISLWMYILFSLGLLLWEVYGFVLMNWPIILANGITFLLVLPILILKIINKD
jgi:MtN3 and saliva related transmembrane protein